MFLQGVCVVITFDGLLHFGDIYRTWKQRVVKAINLLCLINDLKQVWVLLIGECILKPDTNFLCLPEKLGFNCLYTVPWGSILLIYTRCLHAKSIRFNSCSLFGYNAYTLSNINMLQFTFGKIINTNTNNMY